jgi:hypothetical protein
MAAALLAVIGLASCDVDLFGLDSKETGGGYRISLHEGPDQYGLFPPGRSPGISITEIGWQNPLIISRDGNGDVWMVTDTRTRQQTSMSDTQRRADRSYRDIPIYSAKQAWHSLKRRRGQW